QAGPAAGRAHASGRAPAPGRAHASSSASLGSSSASPRPADAAPLSSPVSVPRQDRSFSSSAHGRGGLSKPMTIPLQRVAVGADRVGAAGRGGPGEDAGLGLLELPPGVLLELMVAPAPAAKVAAAGPPALVVGDGVVQVGAPGGLDADRAAARHVAGGDVFAQPRWRPVPRRLVGVRAASR